MSFFLEKTRNQICNIKSIKEKYLSLLEQERQLNKDYEKKVYEEKQINTRFNNEYYDLKEIQRELYRHNTNTDSDKTKYVERKYNKRLFLLGVSFYLIPSFIGFVLHSFISFPSVLVPLISMITCLITVGLDCIFNYKKCCKRYSDIFENLESTKSVRKEIEKLKEKENELQNKLGITNKEYREANLAVQDAEKKLKILRETINLFRINSFEKIIGCQTFEQEVELKLNK